MIIEIVNLELPNNENRINNHQKISNTVGTFSVFFKSLRGCCVYICILLQLLRCFVPFHFSRSFCPQMGRPPEGRAARKEAAE